MFLVFPARDLAFDSITSAVCPRSTLFEGHGRGSRCGCKNGGGLELPPLFSVSHYVRFGPDGEARDLGNALGDNTTGGCWRGRILGCVKANLGGDMGGRIMDHRGVAFWCHRMACLPRRLMHLVPRLVVFAPVSSSAGCFHLWCYSILRI